MEDVRIFLIDLCFPSEVGTPLKEVFDSCEDLRFYVQQGDIIGCERPSFETLFFTKILSFNPHIIFLVLSQNCLDQTNALLQFMREKSCEFPVIVIIEGGELEDITNLLKLGVVDFITPPLRKIDVLPRVCRLLARKSQEEMALNTLKQTVGLKQLVGRSPVFLSEVNKIPLVAKCDVSVLISGETGTGKELFARAIHYLSPRAPKPFAPASCGAIPLELIENELFGHIREAFTGAKSSQPGLIHEADGGTLFLDEIDSLPLPAQTKFLRFLQEKEYKQLGSTKVSHADVRVVAATNLDLEKAVGDGRFRQDLYYRLNIVPLPLPPLRKRRLDIPLLARHFLEKYALEFKKPVKDFSPDAIQSLLDYEWPGNVRELENVIERSIIFSRESIIQSTDIILPHPKPSPKPNSFKTEKARRIEQFEKDYVQNLLMTHHGNISKAAEAAQKNRRAFWELIRKYQIDVHRFKFG
jgi:DNA-binding NtrC family response regulator